MNVWNKVLYCLIAILCIAFSVFAANKYSLAKSKQEELAKLQQNVADVQEAVAQLKAELYGAPTGYDGNWQSLSLNAKLDCVRALKRGETFSNCEPVDASTNGAQTTISFVVPDSYVVSSFQHGAVAYVFDSGAALVSEQKNVDGSAEVESEPESTDVAAADAVLPAKFLGAFKIDAVNGTQASLVSSEVFSAEEAAATSDSAQSGRSWIVCLNLTPVDSPDDLAAFSQENPETFAAYGDELKAFFAMKSVPYPTVDAAALAVENDEETNAAGTDVAAQTPAGTVPEATADSRYPVDFQQILTTQWARRNAENTLKTRREIILARFSEIFFDQLVALEKVDDAVVAKADEKVQALYRQENYQTMYQAAVERKLSPSYAEQAASLQTALGKMVAQRDLVQTKLDDAQAAVARCQKSIEETIVKNAEIASKLAYVQILVAEKIERDAASRTASAEPNFSFNSGI